MSTLREAAQQVLDALAGYRREMNLIRGESYMHGQPCDAEIALRAALEQNEKPVAKIRTWHKGGEQNAELWDWDDGIETLPDGEHLLYASAPLRAALEQKAEPVPAGYLVSPHGEFKPNFNLRFTFPPESLDWSIPLYTAPPQRKPLTDEELDALAIDEDGLPNSHLEFARAIERAHGIGEGE